MRRLLSLVLLAAVVLVTVAPADAGSTAAHVALGLAAFAVFNQLVLAASHAYATPVYAPAPVYGYPGPVVYASAPAYSSLAVPPSRPAAVQPARAVVRYPHGRWELRGDGVTVAYQWVWIPAPPPDVPPPPAGQPPPPPPGVR